MNTIFAGDVGTEIILDCGVDLSTATVLKIVAKTPRGNKKEWTGALTEVTKVKYSLVAGDIDVAGKWAFQAMVTMPGWSGRGEWVEQEVLQ